MNKETCSHPSPALLRSQQCKLCTDCGGKIDWPLNEGQKPLLQPSRADRRVKE